MTAPRTADEQRIAALNHTGRLIGCHDSPHVASPLFSAVLAVEPGNAKHRAHTGYCKVGVD
jgi:hypothetical protein